MNPFIIIISDSNNHQGWLTFRIGYIIREKEKENYVSVGTFGQQHDSCHNFAARRIVMLEPTDVPEMVKENEPVID